MAKKDSLGIDVNFIKEVEELKIKQKLLVQSLKQKSDSQQNKLFLEINSKLDFLVNIFAEAKHSDGVETVPEEGTSGNSVMDKLQEISDSLNKRFDDLEKKINAKVVVKKNVHEVNEFSSQKDSSNSGEEVSEDENLPPIPKFGNEVKIQEDNDVTSKKKRWF